MEVLYVQNLILTGATDRHRPAVRPRKREEKERRRHNRKASWGLAESWLERSAVLSESPKEESYKEKGTKYRTYQVIRHHTISDNVY